MLRRRICSLQKSIEKIEAIMSSNLSQKKNSITSLCEYEKTELGPNPIQSDEDYLNKFDDI